MSHHTWRFLFIIGITVVVFMLRIVLFAASYGGIEHDSGWYLGVAKNLALRGKYASYTNTIIATTKGAHPSIHGRYSVQDDQGYSYFPAGVTAGPGYVIPEALLLKLFGTGWWQYRAWPLIAFSLLLFIVFSIVYFIGGIYSLIFFASWLYVIPQYYLGYAFEAYSEPIALLYLLVSFLFFQKFTTSRRFLWMLASGVCFSFSFLTKNIFLLSAPAFAGVFLLIFFQSIRRYKQHLKTIGVFIVGFLVPIGIYEIYRYITLTSLFGVKGWEAINRDITLHFQSNGGGVSFFQLLHLPWAFVLQKLHIWWDIGIQWSWVPWLLVCLSPFILWVMCREKKDRIWIIFVFLSSIVPFIWYVFVSPSGWARHVWQVIMLSMMLITILLGRIIERFGRYWWDKILYALCIVIVASMMMRQETLQGAYILTSAHINQFQDNRFIRGLEGFPSTPLLSLRDQKELVSYFQTHIKPEDQIYYLGWFIQAEAAPLVDKVMYPITRYLNSGQVHPDGGNAYVLMGPYQKGKWSFMPSEYVPRKIRTLCNSETVLFENTSYTFCQLKDNLEYVDQAYE